MSQIKLKHSGGNSVIIAAPDSNPASDRTLKLPSDGDGTILTTNSSVGKILQVVSTTKTDTFSQSSLNDSTYSNDTGLNVTITPSSSSNKIRLSGSVVVSMDADNDGIGIVLFKNGSVVTGALGSSSGNRTPCMSMSYLGSTGGECETLPFDFLDVAGGTSAITYGIRILFFSGGDSSSTVYMNRSQASDNYVYRPLSISTITAQEVAA